MKNLVFLLLVFLVASVTAGNRIYVSPAGQGQSPISRAMLSARAGDTIVLADGRYFEDVVVERGVVLYSPNIFGAKIIGNGREPVVRLNEGSTISGVVIQGGRNGIISSFQNARIENSFIHSNSGSGILAVNHLPVIVNSLISNNLNSGIQASTIRSVGGELRNLTISQNRRNGIEIDGLEEQIVIIDGIFYRNSNRAIQIRGGENLSLQNLIIFPVQRGLENENRDLVGRPRFRRGGFYQLRDGSIGQNIGADGGNIGFVK